MNPHEKKMTPEILEEKKRKYLESKELLKKYLNELSEILDKAGEEPLSGEDRKNFMTKFDAVDRRFVDRFDVSSFEYFDAMEDFKRQGEKK